MIRICEKTNYHKALHESGDTLGNVVRIPNLMINDLISKYGVEKSGSILSAFAHLFFYSKKDGNFDIYKSGSGTWVRKLQLIHKKTGLPLSFVNLYTPILVKEGLLKMNHNGSVEVIGSRELFKKYLYRFKSNKIIPLIVHKNHKETKIWFNSILVESNLKRQRYAISRKIEAYEQIATISTTITHEEIFKANNADSKSKYIKFNKKAKKLIKKRGSLAIVPNTVLSCKGFANLLTGKANKRVGYTRKKQLQERGYIYSRLNQSIIATDVSQIEYELLKEHLNLPDNAFYSKKNNSIVSQNPSYVVIGDSSLKLYKNYDSSRGISKELPYINLSGVHLKKLAVLGTDIHHNLENKSPINENKHNRSVTITKNIRDVFSLVDYNSASKFNDEALNRTKNIGDRKNINSPNLELQLRSYELTDSYSFLRSNYSYMNILIDKKKYSSNAESSTKFHNKRIVAIDSATKNANL